MPFLDVSDIILDADFCEPVILSRRVETVNGYGESVVTTENTTIYGVVNAGSQPEMVRDADGQIQPNSITVHSRVRLVGPAEGHQPDVIVWNTRRFVVTRTYDYSKYGRGFVAADCASLDYLDTV